MNCFYRAVAGALSFAACLSANAAAGVASPAFVDVQDVPFTPMASELVYAPASHLLMIRNGMTGVTVMNLDTLATTTHKSKWQFTNMSLSPSGETLFVADYGGENIGYGTPLNQSYVHRFNLVKGKWTVDTAYIAGNVQAVSDSRLVLKSDDQWITFTNDKFAKGGALKVLNDASGYWGPGWDAGMYSGDFRYDWHSGRLLHGNWGISSPEINVFAVKQGNFQLIDATGVYGTANGYGGTMALATDGSAFYYGTLAVDVLDVNRHLNIFPQAIHAATGNVAFGDGTLFDAHTAKTIQTLGFASTVYGLNPSGDDFWVFDGSKGMLRHFVPAAAQ